MCTAARAFAIGGIEKPNWGTSSAACTLREAAPLCASRRSLRERSVPPFATIAHPTPAVLQEAQMTQLKGSKTEDNLKAAFAGESQANRRYLYFAAKADVEGQNDVAALFRSTAEGETGHAHGHLEYLEAVGDPATGLPFGTSRLNLEAAIAGETHEYTDMYPGMAKTAREEGFDEIANWFETLAKAERSHANRYSKALEVLSD
jgi:rubrerythrin